MTIRLIARVSLALMIIAAGACSSITTKPLKPTIELVSVVPLNISLSKQQLRFSLKITNPNSFQLPVKSVDFIASFNNTDIASGKSNQSTTIPANGEAILSLDVSARIDRLMATLQKLLKDQNLSMIYDLAGSVQIKNWANPIPFDVSGEMDIEKAFES